jgi:hypothetical protein
VLFAAYLALVICVIAWVRDADLGRWPERAEHSTLLFARACGFAVSLNLATVGVLLGRGDDLALIGRIASVTLLVGGVVLLAGIVAWNGAIARALRGGGWLLVVAVLAVPSTLTLLLLVISPLLFLIGPPASHPERERAAAGTLR